MVVNFPATCKHKTLAATRTKKTSLLPLLIQPTACLANVKYYPIYPCVLFVNLF